MNKNPSASRPALRQADARRARSDAAPLPPVAQHRRRDSDAAGLHPLRRRSPRHGPVSYAEARNRPRQRTFSWHCKTRHRKSAAAHCRRKNCRRWSSPSSTRNVSANAIANQFRQADPPIIGRIQDDKFLLDLRTIFDANDLVPGFQRRSDSHVGRLCDRQSNRNRSMHALHHRHRRPHRPR